MSLWAICIKMLRVSADQRVPGLEGPALTTALLFQTLPTASSAYIMSRQLGGDAPLMAGITAAQSLLALESAGRTAAIYPGSWSDWIRDPRHPVATGSA